MIEIKNLCKSFEGHTVLSNINAVFENRKTNLIIGRSGSGKTVLMKTIVGLLTPEKGEVLYDGRNLVRMNKNEKTTLRREMGMIFQSAALFDSMTVLENVMFPLDMFSKDNYQERMKRALFCLDRVNLIGAEKKYPGEISGGMQKRVAIARAIITRPQIILADEPTGALDSRTSVEVMQLLRQLNNDGMTIVVVTHESGVANVTDKIVHLRDGIIENIEENLHHDASPFSADSIIK